MNRDRKYRQEGYRDAAGQSRADPPRVPRSAPQRTLDSRAVSRCAECGALLPVVPEPPRECPGCGAALHACKQCLHFDPGRRFECTQPIPERIPDKLAGNDCLAFSLRVMIERDASPSSVRREDARRAFDNLFHRRPG